MPSLFSFQGRIGRKTFWLTALALWAVYFVVLFGTIFASGGFEATADQQPIADVNPIVMILLVPFLIVFTWCALAVQVKRWHDRDKSAWWLLVVGIPLIGFFWALVENGFLKGTEGDNRFGPNPV